MTDGDGQYELADAIEAVRVQLAKAQEDGRKSDVRFTVGSVEVEFAVDLTKTAGGGVSVTVPGIVSLGGKGERAWGESHRVKMVLNPLGVGGRPFEVAASASRRPDGPGE